MKKVLFVCIHNSARSQMAEAFLRVIGGDRYEAYSAGIEKGELNPLVVKAMAEIGIDISNQKPKSVFDLFVNGDRFNYVITVCDTKASEKCPIFPGVTHREHWSFEDPSILVGNEEEKLAHIRVIRDEIKSKIEEWLECGKS
jgi:arsenate reductase